MGGINGEDLDEEALEDDVGDGEAENSQDQELDPMLFGDEESDNESQETEATHYLSLDGRVFKNRGERKRNSEV